MLTRQSNAVYFMKGAFEDVFSDGTMEISVLKYNDDGNLLASMYIRRIVKPVKCSSTEARFKISREQFQEKCRMKEI